MTVEEERQQNEALARQINKDARTNAKSPYRGKYVGIVGGKVVVVTDTLDELVVRLKQIEPDPRRRFGVLADDDYDRTDYIWVML